MFAHSGDDHGPESLTRRAALGSTFGVLGMFMDATLVENEAMADPTRSFRPDASTLRPGPTRPRVYTRSEWGAKRAKKPTKVVSRTPDRIIVHHTATPNSTDYSLAHAYKLSRSIQRFHMRHRGWNDTGQQLTISRGGHVMEGRDGSLSAILGGRHAIGAQALHHNHHTIGIENEGTYTKAPVPELLWSSLVTVCSWLCVEYRLDPYRAIVGHRDYGHTDCPGNNLYARLPELRAAVAARIPRPPRAPKPRSTSTTKPTPEVSDSTASPEPSASPSGEVSDVVPPLDKPSSSTWPP